MARLSDSSVDDMVRCCLSAYDKLPKTGKPVENEWTVLSCVVQYDASNGKHEVVSLGTGTKCVGASVMSSGVGGGVLHDSHAEVCARRAALLHLYSNLRAAINRNSSIFKPNNDTFTLEDNIQFVFYSSQLPCGDASILPKTDNEHIGELLTAKRPAKDQICDTTIKKLKVENDIHRTGAKCLPEAEQDLQEPGSNYHLLSRVRTKPGRGERTLSVSCSDKMARWAHIGIQGALLDLLCGPIFIKHFIFGGGVPYSKESLTRALLKRDGGGCLTKVVPEFYQSSVVFPHIKTEMNMRPSPGSIVWVKGNLPEVAVQGRKLGLTKKKTVLPNHFLCISKYKLYKAFISAIQCNADVKQSILKDVCFESLPYSEMKKKSVRYIAHWAEVKEKFFKQWTVKPDIWKFCVTGKSATV